MQEKRGQSLADGMVCSVACPGCGQSIPRHHGYAAWCDGCGWNLNPSIMGEPRNVFEELQLKFGARLGEGLFKRMLAEADLRPRLTFATMLAYGIAGIVHMVTVLFFLVGVITIIIGWPNIVMIVLGVLSACIAIAARPRISSPPAPVLPRERFPTLYRLVDEVADALGAKKVDHIVADCAFNASFGVLGWRRKGYLTLGIPFFVIHSDAERVALLGHEIGHSVNGDSARGLYLHSAIQALVCWYHLVLPESLLSSESGMPGLLMLPVNLLLCTVAWGIRLLISALVHLLYHSSQRAEYLADYLSAVVGGRDAAISSTQLIYHQGIFAYTVQRVANNPDGLPLFDELRRQMAMLPERELERVRRVSMMAESRFDATHPPTAHRIRFLEARCQGTPQVVLSPEDSERLNEELAQLYDEEERAILDEYRNSLYL